MRRATPAASSCWPRASRSSTNDELRAQRRLQLPGPQVARRVEGVVEVDQRIVRRIPETGGLGEPLGIAVAGGGVRRGLVELQLVVELGGVAPQDRQQRQALGPQ